MADILQLQLISNALYTDDRSRYETAFILKKIGSLIYRVGWYS